MLATILNEMVVVGMVVLLDVHATKLITEWQRWVIGSVGVLELSPLCTL